MIEMADGDPPYTHIDPMRTLYVIADRQPPTFRKPKMFSESCNEFLTLALIFKKDDRPDVSEMLIHEWVAESAKRLTSSEVKGRSPAIRRVVEDNLDEIHEFRKGNFLREDRRTGDSQDADTAIFLPFDASIFLPEDEAKNIAKMQKFAKQNQKKRAPLLRMPSAIASLVDEETVVLENVREVTELHDRFVEVEKQFRYDVKSFAQLYRKRKVALQELLVVQ